MTGEKLPPVPKPEGFEEFCALASALFGLEETGGPLHVHLDDHNTELLVGDAACGTIAAYNGALALIESGNVPVGPTGWHEPNGKTLSTAYYYGPVWAAERNQPLEQLRLAVKILTITESWTEDQADAAYAEWMSDCGGPCGCSIYPTFIESEVSK
jgi:hypothetical protein